MNQSFWTNHLSQGAPLPVVPAPGAARPTSRGSLAQAGARSMGSDCPPNPPSGRDQPAASGGSKYQRAGQRTKKTHYDPETGERVGR